MNNLKITCKICNKLILLPADIKNDGLCLLCKNSRKDAKKSNIAFKVKPKRYVDSTYIEIEKDSETLNYINYVFYANVWDKDPRFNSRLINVGKNKGLFGMDKRNGIIKLLTEMPEDKNGIIFNCAATTIYKAWETGEYPNKTFFELC